MSAAMKIDSYDIWWDAQKMADWHNCSAEHWRSRIACAPDFPKPSYLGRTKQWCLGEVSEYLRNRRDTVQPKRGRPRKVS